MSSNEYAVPLTLNLRPSQMAVSILFFVHLGAMISIMLMPVIVFFKILTSFLVLVSLWNVSCRVLLKKAGSIKQIIWGEDNNWILKTIDGRSQSAQLLPSTYVHTWVTVLNFKKLNSKELSAKMMFNVKMYRSCSSVLLPDVIDADELRRLRVRLTLVQYSLLE